VITGLGAGGAQTMLRKVVAATRQHGILHSVASLVDGGVVAAQLASDGVQVKSLGIRHGKPDPRGLTRLVQWLRRERPDVVQSWMYHADLLAGVAAFAAGRFPVIWGIRHSDVDPRHFKRLTRWTRSACARLSSVLPSRIVSCAESAARSHEALGYSSDRIVVIPNGFDVARLVRDPDAGARIRDGLGIPNGAPVVGVLARFNPDKDHATFLDAAALTKAGRRDVHFVLAGDRVDESNAALRARIDALGLRDIRLVGHRTDVPALLSAFDLLALPSRTEGFPNVLGEAMSCGVPCVSTDCGDAREIVGDTGRIVPPQDPSALSRAMLEVLALSSSERAALGAAAARRIRDRYDMRIIAERFARLYRDIARDGGRRGEFPARRRAERDRRAASL
jgi:glycosyltransferase involved in cell wall biosynthesis